MEEAHYDVPWEFVHRKGLFLRERPRSACTESVSLKQVDKGVSCASVKESLVITPVNFHRQPKIPPPTRNGKVTALEDKDAKPSTSKESERAKVKLKTGRVSDLVSVSRREKFCEQDLIHYGMDRILAERRLADSGIGTFLVRLRENNSLALSIRSNKRVLHIKLELRNNRWVLGEGPSFGSVASVITFYRCHELPIRGAEHIVLTSPILAPTVHSC